MGIDSSRILVPEVEAYLHHLTPPSPGVLPEMEARAAERGFPIIGPLVGRLLWLLASSRGARTVLEMGSGFGYSTAWFALAVGEGGKVVWTDSSTENCRQARDDLGRMGLNDRVEYHVGDSLEIAARIGGSYDIVFIDVDKHRYPEALDRALPRLAVGGLLVVDNALWSGDVARSEAESRALTGIRELNRRIYTHPDLLSVILPLRDGVAVCHRMR